MRFLLHCHRRGALTAFRQCQTAARRWILASSLSTWTLDSDLRPTKRQSTTSQQQRRTLFWNANADVYGDFGSYKEEYELSLRDPETYWKKAADQLEWFEKPQTILDYDANLNPHFPKWFPDGVFNMAYNCLDVHVHKHGRGKQDALLYDSPVTGVKQRFTYEELLHQVSTLAGAMKDLGVESGDRVGKYKHARMASCSS